MKGHEKTVVEKGVKICDTFLLRSLLLLERCGKIKSYCLGPTLTKFMLIKEGIRLCYFILFLWGL